MTRRSHQTGAYAARRYYLPKPRAARRRRRRAARAYASLTPRQRALLEAIYDELTAGLEHAQDAALIGDPASPGPTGILRRR